MALCLSGGGYRAALFHMGAMRRLNELGILSQVGTISGVSGGSIAAALLAGRINQAEIKWPAPGEVIADWDTEVARPLRAFTRKNIRTMWVAKRLVPPWRLARSTVAVETLARRYEKDLIAGDLAALPDRPRFVFSATDMSFGVNWTSEKSRVGDYQAGYIAPPPQWPTGRAVAASSCFPPVFDPLPIDLSPDKLKGGLASRRLERSEYEALVNRLRLSDGGVYDNMGLEPVWKDHEVVLVSDGGAPFKLRPDRGFPRRLGRYLSVISNQAGAIRKRWLVSNFISGELAGAYWGINASTAHYEDPIKAYGAELVERVISRIRTDLDCFSDAEQAVLENHGYLVAEAAIKRHAPALVSKTAPLKIPFPAWMSEDRVRRELARSHKRRLLGRWRAWPPALPGWRRKAKG